MSEQTTAPPSEEQQPNAPEEPAKAQETPPEPETVTLPKAEADALRRRVAEAEKAQRKLEASQKKAEEERQAEQGKWQELAEQRDRELASERGERARVQREQRITRLASKAKFLDPADVIGRISAEDGEEDSSTEAALERIAEASPHLIAKEAPVAPEIGQVLSPGVTTPSEQAPKPPPGQSPLRTLADLDALEAEGPEAVSKRMAEVDWLLSHQK